jgi:hypothetical protein
LKKPIIKKKGWWSGSRCRPLVQTPVLQRKKKKKNLILAKHQWLTPIIKTIWEAEIKRIAIQGQPRKTVLENLICKITRAKWTGDMAQEVDHFFSECKEALNSKPVPPKGK